MIANPVKKVQIKIPHPDNDGTYVIFYEPSVRQLEVLKYYEHLTGEQPKKAKAKKRYTPRNGSKGVSAAL